MTDINVGISKIYQFIKNDIYQMDLDGNGEINEAEAKYFLKDSMNKGNISLDDGDNPNDIISAFWKKINTNRAGKSIVKLDNNELDSLNQKIEMYEKFENYFDNNIITKLNSNKYITDSESREKWIKSVKESLLNSVDQFITKGGKPEQLESFLNGQLDNKYYADPTRKNVAQLAMNKTTANIYAQKYIQEQLGDIGATFSDLQKLIDDLVTKEIGDGDMTDDVISKTKAVVDDYLAQASGNYEFSDKEKKQALTEYQGYTLKNQLTEVLKGVEKEEGYAENKELYDGAVTSYIDSLVSGSLKGDYNKNFALSYDDILNSTEFKDVKKKIADIIDLKTLPDDFWSGLPDSITLAYGKSQSFTLPNSYTTPNGVEVTSDRISYKSSNSRISVNSDGEVTVSAGNNAGTTKISVSVMLDGNLIGTKEVTLKVLSEEECFKQTSGEEYKINADNFDYSGIDGYYTNAEYELEGQGTTAAEAKAKEVLNALKQQIKNEVKQNIEDKGISFDKISTIFENVYAQSVEEAAYHGVDGKKGNWFRHSYSWYHTKDLVDLFIKTFNGHLSEEIDKQRVK